MKIHEIIITESCKYYGYERNYITSKTRKGDATKVRYFAYYMIRSETKLTLKAIGKLFSSRDHSSVLHGIQQVKSFNDIYPKTKVTFDADYEIVFGNVRGKIGQGIFANIVDNINVKLQSGFWKIVTE